MDLKVGDSVHVVFPDHIAEMVVGFISPEGETVKGRLTNLYLVTDRSYHCAVFEDVGVTVFREKAEAQKVYDAAEDNYLTEMADLWEQQAVEEGL